MRIATNLLILFFVTTTTAACKKRSTQSLMPEDNNIYSRALEPATVIYYRVDGCTWMLQLPSGERLQPVALDESFQKEGMKVRIAYDVVPDAVTICMAGKVVKLIRIIQN